MDIFGADNPDDLERKIEGSGADDTGDDDAAATEPDADPSHLYRKYHRGVVLPSDPRIVRWQALCHDADRVPKLALWWVLKHEPVPDGSTLDQLLSVLPDNIRRAIFFPGMVDLSDRRFHSVLDSLDRISSIDAITALVIFTRSCEEQLVAEEAETATWWIAVSIREMFYRLATFPPFFTARRRLYDHLGACVYTRLAEEHRLPVDHDQVSKATHENRRLLTLLGRLGLIGPTFREQVKWLYAYELNTGPGGALAEIEEACDALKPIAPSPANPLWDTLKWLRHPGTRSNRPIEMPYKGRFRSDFRIANALGETGV